jgi:hypothetical protein
MRDLVMFQVNVHRAELMHDSCIIHVLTVRLRRRFGSASVRFGFGSASDTVLSVIIFIFISYSLRSTS